MGTSDDVERIAAPVLQAAGLDLVDVEIRSGNIVVTVDREGGFDLDTLASVSRAISAAIDQEEVGPPAATSSRSLALGWNVGFAGPSIFEGS